MSWLLGAFFIWLLWRFVAWVVRSVIKWTITPWRQRIERLRLAGRAKDYQLSTEQNMALALAHPMAFYMIPGGFASAPLCTLSPEQGQALRPQTLHYFGFRTDLSDADARQQVPAAVRSSWFSKDLDLIQPTDTPREIMALACARSAFFVRCAALLGWLDEPLQWQVLALNAARAHECFDSWATFAHAYTAGRDQWVKAGRSDTLGRLITPEETHTWLAAPWHPWGSWPWSTT